MSYRDDFASEIFRIMPPSDEGGGFCEAKLGGRDCDKLLIYRDVRTTPRRERPVCRSACLCDFFGTLAVVVPYEKVKQSPC